MVFIDEFPSGAVDFYADTLTRTATALARQDVTTARTDLEPIAGELWTGRVRAPISSQGTPAAPRRVKASARARVLIRDRFRCTYCGGRGVPWCVLVAISDVFPDAFADNANYKRAAIHPAYWVLVLEADHTIAHTHGGSDDDDNLTAMHALCNTTKSNAHLRELETPELIAATRRWDGLISTHAGIVRTGESHGRRHAAPTYHADWLRRFPHQPGST